MADRDDARKSGDTDGPGEGGPIAVETESRLARRWRTLDRGWQALCLGLAIVGAHVLIYAV